MGAPLLETARGLHLRPTKTSRRLSNNKVPRVPIAVKPISDSATIHAILIDPWVSLRIRHDNREPEYVDHPAIAYYGAYVDGELAGVFLAIRHTPEDVEVHAALLRKATRHGRRLGQAFLDALWQDEGLLRITAPVLSTLPSAANYCRKLGFKDEGVKRQACRVNGAPVDIIYLGLLRDACADVSEGVCGG